MTVEPGLDVEPCLGRYLADMSDLVIAGWTGRDVESLEKHIRELEEVGVPRPASVPCFYRVSVSQLTMDTGVQFLGSESSGEIEVVLYGTEEGMMIGVGSDHTDRKVETYSVSVSKQMCAKPVSSKVWRYDEVADHFDELLLRSRISENGVETHYQEGSVAAMRRPEELIGLCFDGAAALPAGTAMFCGTLPVIGRIRSADMFLGELEDPVLKRKISLEYRVETLPVVT